MYRISFITEDKTISSYLIKLGNFESQNERSELLGFIPDNFCRDESGLTESLRKFVMMKETTVIFVNGGHEILGMTILTRLTLPRPGLNLEVICAPESEVKGIGTMLLHCVKKLAVSIELPVFLLALNDSLKSFYVKQGFVKYDESDFYVFNNKPSGGGKKVRKSRKSRKSRKVRKVRKVRRSINARKLGRCTRARARRHR
jgi:hypothetical protein